MELVEEAVKSGRYLSESKVVEEALADFGVRGFLGGLGADLRRIS